MAFFNSAVTVLQTLVIALGVGLGIWGAINLLEGYGNDNPGANGNGCKRTLCYGTAVNETEVSTEDRLFDHVQHYNSKEVVMENAAKRVSCLEKEKEETKAAKKRIHERLGEKKQQSAAKKAEKAVDKAVKKDKGQEL